MRYLLDALLIVVLLVIGSALQDYSEKLRTQEPLQERVDQFEQDISSGKIIRDVYSTKKPYLKQIEENGAGKLAQKASDMVIDFVDITMNFTSEVMKQVWK